MTTRLHVGPVPPASGTGGSSRILIAFAALVIGGAVLAAIIRLGPVLAGKIVTAAGGDAVSVPLADSIFNIVIFGAILIAAAIGGAASGINPFKFGIRPVTMLPLGLFVGLFGVMVTAGYAAVAGVLSVGDAVQTSGGLLLWGAAIVLLQAGAEEIFFRGWLQPVIARAGGTAMAVVIGAVAFAALHVFGGARAPLTLVNLFLGGVLFGLLAEIGRGILAAATAHFAWNGAEQLVLGLDPNPGVGSFGSLINFDLMGAPIWGGSEEGLNASFAMTVTLLAIVIPMVWLTWRRPKTTT